CFRLLCTCHRTSRCLVWPCSPYTISWPCRRAIYIVSPNLPRKLDWCAKHNPDTEPERRLFAGRGELACRLVLQPHARVPLLALSWHALYRLAVQFRTEQQKAGGLNRVGGLAPANRL